MPALQVRCPPVLHPVLSLSSFDFLRVIGSGSFAQVRLARMKDSHTPAAVKIMKKMYILRTKQVAHVLAEKQIVRLVDSPFIVAFLGSFQDSVNLYCVLEYVPGGELFRLLCERETLSRAEATFYAAEVTLALCTLHAIRCAYRDLKPENILISATGHVKLADFGLAKVLKHRDRTFTTCGTPEYIAPEIIEGMGYDETSDWWQLGILLYEMISAQTPFATPSPYELYSNILTKKVAFPSSFDEVTKDFIGQLLHKDPHKRIQQQDILQHRFFADMNWPHVKALQLHPPFVPTIADPFDSSYFENFTEKPEEEAVLDASMQAQFDGY